MDFELFFDLHAVLELFSKFFNLHDLVVELVFNDVYRRFLVLLSGFF